MKTPNEPKLPDLSALKRQASLLRTALAAEGNAISHSGALELLARQHGFRDWNGLHAAATESVSMRDRLTVGARVRGRYIGRPFEGEVVGVRRFGTEGGLRLVVHFDKPVDVVKVPTFSAWRQRVSCTIDRHGRTAERTSDGRPHLELETGRHA
ncbi:MAG: glyoxalase superfamily protein [Pseudomonadota bacterium]